MCGFLRVSNCEEPFYECSFFRFFLLETHALKQFLYSDCSERNNNQDKKVPLFNSKLNDSIHSIELSRVITYLSKLKTIKRLYHNRMKLNVEKQLLPTSMEYI